MPADRLLAFLRERRSHQALVVDASETVVGLITLEDVVGELLGGVADEFKGAQLRADPPVRRPRFGCPASMRLEQAAPLIGQPWSGADTVGDLIVERLGRVPEPGEEVDRRRRAGRNRGCRRQCASHR